jgi:hypothetical protein
VLAERVEVLADGTTEDRRVLKKQV